MKINFCLTRRIAFFLVILCTSISKIFAQNYDSPDDWLKASLYQTNQKKDYAKAIQLCKQGLVKTPNYVDLRLQLGRLYMLTNRNNDARKELIWVLQKRPGDVDALRYLANLEAKTGRRTEAICYIDEALAKVPGDRELLLKKSSVYMDAKLYDKAFRIIDDLLEVRPDDDTLRSIYIEQHLEVARLFAKNNQYYKARPLFELVLTMQPRNNEAKEYLINNSIRSGNVEQALQYVDEVLNTSPNNYEWMRKKTSLLTDLHRYPEAIELVEKMTKLFPSQNGTLSRQLIELRLLAGGYMMKMDPYNNFTAVLEKQPSNKEALSQVINMALARNNTYEALFYINKALAVAPGDADLLFKKSIVYEMIRNYEQAVIIMQTLVSRSPNNRSYQDRLIELLLINGKEYLTEGLWDKAETAFKTILLYQPNQLQALNYLVSLYVQQKKYNEAIVYQNDIIRIEPTAEARFKKANMLMDAGRYVEASKLLQKLYETDKTTAYKNALVEAYLASAKSAFAQEETDSARLYTLLALRIAPNDTTALHYIINTESGLKNYTQALYWCDKALDRYPESKSFKLKKASILESAGLYKEASKISYRLVQEYPYSQRIRNIYLNHRLMAGLKYNRNDKPDSAMLEFKAMLEVEPNDTNALYYLSQTYTGQKQYDSSLYYINAYLVQRPEDEQGIFKKAATLENMKLYDSAAYIMKPLTRRFPDKKTYTDYYDYLYSMTLRNQIGVFWLHSNFNDASLPSDIITLHYQHNFKEKHIILNTRINYAPRPTGNGIQLEGEAFWTHSPKYYSQILVDISNNIIFPRIKLGYSLFKNFQKGWEGEAGLRYFNADSLSALSVTAAASKTFKDYWFNARTYFIPQFGKLNLSLNLTARYYMNNFSDYIGALLAVGSSPDDKSRVFLLNNSLQFLSTSVGISYQKTIRYRNIFSAAYTLTNQKITPSSFQLQQLLYLTYIRKI